MPSGVDPSFRKLWRNHNESYPEKSVRARGENINRMLPVLLSWDADQGKFQRISFRAADPISLRCFNTFRPIYFLKTLQEPLGIVGYPKKPLFQVFFLDFRSASFAFFGLDLLICQNCFARRTPVYRRSLAVREAFFKHLRKNPLGPFVILGIVSFEFLLPRESVSDHLKLAIKIFLGYFREPHRMSADSKRVIFRMHSKTVEPDRLENVISFHPLKDTETSLNYRKAFLLSLNQAHRHRTLATAFAIFFLSWNTQT